MAEADTFNFAVWAKIFAAALLIYYIASTTYSWSLLRKVPGPFFAGISSLWEMSVTATGQEAWVYNDLAKKYGHLVRISPNHVLTDDPDVLRRISGVRATYGKDGFYSGSLKHPDYDTMFSTMDTSTHDAIKAKLAGPYGGRETAGLEPIVDEIITALRQHLREEISLGPDRERIVDFGTIVAYFAMDVITRATFGRNFGFLRTHSDAFGLIAASRAAFKTYTIPMSIDWLRNITTSRYFLKAFGPKTTDKTGPGVIMRALQEELTKRFDPDAPQEKDLLGGFVRNGLSMGACISEALFAQLAGSDTAASTIRCTMLYLMTTPPVYQKLKEVVREAVKEGRVSSPIKQDEARMIPYLQAVIYEGLRMRPPVPIKFFKVVPPQGDTIDGIFLPGGTAVGWNLVPMLRSPRHWGANSEVFRPERFTEADEDTRSSMERLIEMCFGHGRFACAGKPLAIMELNKVYFEIVNPSKPWNSELWTVWVDDDFLVQITEAAVY